MERKKIGKGKQEKKRYQRIGKEEIKLSVFTDYMFYIWKLDQFLTENNIKLFLGNAYTLNKCMVKFTS